jgi:hypothetical protein
MIDPRGRRGAERQARPHQTRLPMLPNDPGAETPAGH